MSPQPHLTGALIKRGTWMCEEYTGRESRGEESRNPNNAVMSQGMPRGVGKPPDAAGQVESVSSRSAQRAVACLAARSRSGFPCGEGRALPPKPLSGSGVAAEALGTNVGGSAAPPLPRPRGSGNHARMETRKRGRGAERTNGTKKA